jgi:hypothetical protein
VEGRAQGEPLQSLQVDAMGQRISVQIEQGGGDGVKGSGGRLSLTPTPRKQQSPAAASPLADSTNTTGAPAAGDPSTPSTMGGPGVQGAAPPLLGQPSPDDHSVVDLCESPAAASTPTNGKSSSSTSSFSNQFVLMEIPDDVTRCLLTSLSLPSLVKLSVCSKSLAESVFSRSYLWQKIDLSKLSYYQCNALTDRSLHRLLDAINAKGVTKALSIGCCNNIQGFGLEPLRGSQVIEELDLRKKYFQSTDGTGLEDSFVVNLLGTMMPFARPTHANYRSGMTSRLFTVRFNAQKKPPLTNGVATASRIQECFYSYGQVKKFLDSFDGSLKDRLWIDRVPCSHCNEPLVEKVPIEQFENNDASMLRCFECKSVSCGQKECPPIKRCQMCFSDLCCVNIGTCELCRVPICRSCCDVDECQGPCKRMIGDCCGLILECGVCKTKQCEDCTEMQFCYMCEEYYCCVEVSQCGLGYDCSFCSRCYPNPNRCSRCERTFCEDCDPEELSLCDGCNKLVCIYCEDLSDPCGGCNGMFCSNCRDISKTYDCCDEQYCHSCLPNFEECGVCQQCLFCCSDLSGCTKCMSWYGDKCLKVDGCRDCGMSFCAYCSSTDSKGGLTPCSYCHELICPSCREDSQVSDVLQSVPFCSGCSENVQATSFADSDDSSSSKSSDRRSRKNKADSLSSKLCELKLERARARRRLEATTEKVRSVEEKMLVSDPGWFPVDSIL